MARRPQPDPLPQCNQTACRLESEDRDRASTVGCPEADGEPVPRKSRPVEGTEGQQSRRWSTGATDPNQPQPSKSTRQQRLIDLARRRQHTSCSVLGYPLILLPTTLALPPKKQWQLPEPARIERPSYLAHPHHQQDLAKSEPRSKEAHENNAAPREEGLQIWKELQSTKAQHAQSSRPGLGHCRSTPETCMQA